MISILLLFHILIKTQSIVLRRQNEDVTLLAPLLLDETEEEIGHPLGIDIVTVLLTETEVAIDIVIVRQFVIVEETGRHLEGLTLRQGEGLPHPKEGHLLPKHSLLHKPAGHLLLIRVALRRQIEPTLLQSATILLKKLKEQNLFRRKEALPTGHVRHLLTSKRKSTAPQDPIKYS